MTQEIRFPLRLQKAFFKSLQFKRSPTIPERSQLPISVLLRVLDKDFPDTLQIELKVETVGEQPLALSLELVGQFSQVEDRPKADRSVIPSFINEQALHMLWPYMVQMIRLVTGQMGMSPVDIPIPYLFNFQPQEQTTGSSVETKGNFVSSVATVDTGNVRDP